MVSEQERTRLMETFKYEPAAGSGRHTHAVRE
jgi:hypothetical protein